MRALKVTFVVLGSHTVGREIKHREEQEKNELLEIDTIEKKEINDSGGHGKMKADPQPNRQGK